MHGTPHLDHDIRQSGCWRGYLLASGVGTLGTSGGGLFVGEGGVSVYSSPSAEADPAGVA